MTDLNNDIFKTIEPERRGTTSEEVISQLREMIHRGDLRPGDRLPPERSPAAPEVPTAAEAGYPQLTFRAVTGFFGGPDMPASLRERIAADVRAIAADPAIKERLAKMGAVAAGSRSTPAMLAPTARTAASARRSSSRAGVTASARPPWATFVRQSPFARRRIAVSTRSSLIPRRRSCRSTIRARWCSKSVSGRPG